jgi:hypothetical protein
MTHATLSRFASPEHISLHYATRNLDTILPMVRFNYHNYLYPAILATMDLYPKRMPIHPVKRAHKIPRKGHLPQGGWQLCHSTFPGIFCPRSIRSSNSPRFELSLNRTDVFFKLLLPSIKCPWSPFSSSDPSDGGMGKSPHERTNP